MLLAAYARCLGRRKSCCMHDAAISMHFYLYICSVMAMSWFAQSCIPARDVLPGLSREVCLACQCHVSRQKDDGRSIVCYTFLQTCIFLHML
jgi:hypothetical protein